MTPAQDGGLLIGFVGVVIFDRAGQAPSMQPVPRSSLRAVSLAVLAASLLCDRSYHAAPLPAAHPSARDGVAADGTFKFPYLSLECGGAPTAAAPEPCLAYCFLGLCLTAGANFLRSWW